MLPQYVIEDIRRANVITIAEENRCSLERAEKILKRLEREEFFTDQTYPIKEYRRNFNEFV